MESDTIGAKRSTSKERSKEYDLTYRSRLGTGNGSTGTVSGTCESIQVKCGDARVRKRYVCTHASTRGIDQPMGVCHKHSAILLIPNSQVKSVTKRFALRDETNAVIHVVLDNAAL